MKTINRILLWSGFLPAAWFLLFVTVGGLFVRTYSPIAQQASELTLVAGAPRMMVDIAAIGVGIFLTTFASGLWMTSGRAVAFGAIAWILFGISMASNGIWVMGSPMHGAYGLGLIVMVAPALSTLEMGSAGRDRLTYWISGAVSFLGVFYFWLNTLGFDPPHYRGLTQRVYATITLLWPAWSAYRLLSQNKSKQSSETR